MDGVATTRNTAHTSGEVTKDADRHTTKAACYRVTYHLRARMFQQQRYAGEGGRRRHFRHAQIGCSCGCIELSVPTSEGRQRPRANHLKPFLLQDIFLTHVKRVSTTPSMSRARGAEGWRGNSLARPGPGPGPRVDSSPRAPPLCPARSRRFRPTAASAPPSPFCSEKMVM